MQTSIDVKNIFKAQIAMQSELENIAKDSSGYGYKYTSLEKLIEYVRPILAKHKLGYFQTTTSTEDGKIGVTTRLIHESGEWVEDTMVANLTKLAKMNEYQVAGSVITYFRRYALSAMLGIASDEDMDASTPQQQTHQQPQPSREDNLLILRGLITKTSNPTETEKFFCEKVKINNLNDMTNGQVLWAIGELNKKGIK